MCVLLLLVSQSDHVPDGEVSDGGNRGRDWVWKDHSGWLLALSRHPGQIPVPHVRFHSTCTRPTGLGMGMLWG